MMSLLYNNRKETSGTFLSGSIDNLNVLTEQDLIGEVVVSALTKIDRISIDYVNWYVDANITGTGANLIIRVYIDDDDGGTLREVTSLQEIITEGVSGSGKTKLGGFGTVERNYKVTVQSSIAPVGGAASDLVKYNYVTFDKE